MKSARQILASTGTLVVALFAVSLAVYGVFIHPNDQRVAVAPAPAHQIESFYQRAASLLINRLEHRLDLPAAAFAEKHRALMAALPEYAMASSARFTSPYQIYLPLGSYPLKLDAQDGLFIPDGATLTLKPGLTGPVSMRFAAASPLHAATLTYGVVGGAQGDRLALPAPPDPHFDANNAFYRGYWRFFAVDPQASLSSWRDVQKSLVLKDHDQLTFTCAGGPHGCVISDVAFYTPRPEKPNNVLVILVDTLRSDAVHGGNAPHMASLAAASVDFTQALAAGNMTSPSTNAFLSCRRPSQLGELAFAYTVTNDFREAYYRERQLSFPERFRKAGYDTAMIGNVSVISEIYGVGISHGFSRQVSLETDGYDTPMTAREAVRWLTEHGDHPFFLYLHFNAPHAPYRAPLGDIFATYPGFAAFKSYPGMLRWLYQGEVHYTDRYLEVVLSALGRLGLADQTTVVLTADHGDQHTQHDFRGNHAGPDFSGAYFDHGATLLNDEIRVPLVIHTPQALPARVDEYVSTLDLGPTLLALHGLSVDKCAGESLAPLLTKAAVHLPERVLGSEGFRDRAIVFKGRYKYIRTYEATDKKIYDGGRWTGDKTLYLVPEQLFDLRSDPSEEHNLVTAEPGILAAARRLYREVFNIKDAFELIVESPQAAAISVDIPGQPTVQFEEGDGPITVFADHVHLSSSGHSRIQIEIKGRLEGLPVVEVGGRSLPVGETSMRLPIKAPLTSLPAEMGGRFTLLDIGKDNAAYLRMVEDDGQKNRRLMTGNPSFEKVLREWGYLNDK